VRALTVKARRHGPLKSARTPALREIVAGEDSSNFMWTPHANKSRNELMTPRAQKRGLRVRRNVGNPPVDGGRSAALAA